MKGIKYLLLATILWGCASHRKNVNPIHEALESKNDEYRQCFLESDSYKGRHSIEKGIVRVFFIIDSMGKVKEPKILESAFKDPNFHACLLSMVRSIQFTPPKDGGTVEVSQPINFYPSDK